jgi:hypothetical protein
MARLWPKGELSVRSLLALIMLVALGGTAQAEPARPATLYKDPACACCEAYARYLRENGFEVAVEARHDLPLLKRQHGVPGELEGCHTTLVDGYVVEGHVPVGTLVRLLTEKPAIKGISLPGMPAGSPGMFGEKAEPFAIYAFGAGPAKVYAVE